MPCTRNRYSEAEFPSRGSFVVRSVSTRSVDARVPCNRTLRTVSGLDGSSTKQIVRCAAGEPAGSHRLSDHL